MNLQSNDFELFGLTQQFAQDRSTVDARWKSLQREAHPDKFAAQGAAAQRVAMQWSVRINEAYQRLKDPLKRAAYLCELGGAPINAHSNTAMPATFLMQQMEWRESLEEACDTQALEQLRQQVDVVQRDLMQQCEALLARLDVQDGLLTRVRRLLLTRPGDFPDLESAASALHTSGRSLRRHLAAAGTSYQQVLDEVRKRLALQYLETTHLPLFEIAVLLGFSDPSNFRRAFRKWTGRAPTDYRARPVTPEENDR